MLRLLLFVPFFAGCVSQQFYSPTTARYNGTEGKSLRTQVMWTKNKGKAVDVGVRFYNEYGHPVVLKSFMLETSGIKVAPKDLTSGLELQAGQASEQTFVFPLMGYRQSADKKATFSFAAYEGNLNKMGKQLPSFSQSYEMCAYGNTVCDGAAD